jgi:hypothetical protein
LLDALHSDTKEWVIKDNLFINEGEELNAYKLADNERYLRTLNFIQDARILVRPVRGTDSVDIEVVTKDLFTITGGLDIGGITRFKATAAEANFLGMGQRLQFTTLVDRDRNPPFGYEALYTKNSVFGSLIDASVGYTTIGPNLFDGKEEETSYFLSLDRPLVSPFTRYAGGLYLAHKETQKAYTINRPDSFFYGYTNNTFDVWAGVNIADSRLLNSKKVRDRRFFAMRYAQTLYDRTPEQVGTNFDPIFNDVKLVLGQLTLFRQNFFKTNYVYGFGITEDVPYGYNVSLIGGWHRQLTRERPYFGIKANSFVVTSQGGFYKYFIHAGSFFHSQQLEDASLLAGVNWYSKLCEWKGYRVRQFLGLTYSGLYNSLTTDLLRINNPFGLRNFSYPYLLGTQRINAQTETAVYLDYKFLGFKFAPFIAGDAVLLKPQGVSFGKSDIYTGIGAGVRTRNENLVFGTMELRAVYFPRYVEGHNSFKILFSSNLRYRYNNSHVNKPDLVRLNIDETQ